MKEKIIIGILILTLIVGGYGIKFAKNYVSQSMDYTEFLQLVDTESVQQVEIKNNENLIVTTNDGEKWTVPNPQKQDFKEFLLLNKVKVVQGTNTNVNGAFPSLIILALIGGTMIYLRKGKGDKQLIQDVHKSPYYSEATIKFENIAGNDEAKEMVQDIVEFIRNPEKYNKTGAKMPRGVLLYGMPGTGKTLMAKAIAGEAGVPFYAMSGSDFVQMYVGVGANRVRQLFKTARKSEKAVIFIDEIDALGKSRSGNASSANDEREQTLNALLTEMSGFNSKEGIVVIGATNRVDTLDAALLRPGRFDRHIEVTLPDQPARKSILQLYLKDKPVADTVDIDLLASQTVLFSGAMLENLVNEAAIIAANDDSPLITDNHVNRAFYNVVAGVEKKGIVQSKEKEITAYHEAGHALVSKLLLPETTVAKVTIIPTTKGAGGYNFSIPKDRMYKTKREIIGHIQVLLAGRAAEMLVFGEDNVTTGAVNDIKEASKELHSYYGKFGMDDELGMFNLEDNSVVEDEIVSACRVKMKELFEETKNLLEAHMDELTAISTQLISQETLNESELDEIICQHSH